MKTYELTYILSSALNQEESDRTKEAVEKSIQAAGGVLLSSDQKIQTLAYPIQKQSSGQLRVASFQAEENKVFEIQKELSGQKGVLRHLMVVKKQTRVKPRRTRPPFQATATPQAQSTEKVNEADLDQKLEEILGE